MSRIYMWDDKWDDETADFDTYAAKLKTGSITDVMVEVYGAFQGGTMGWVSAGPCRIWDQMIDGVLDDYITAMNAINIRVHAVFLTCRHQATDDGSNGQDFQYPADVDSDSGLLVDPRIPGVDLADGIEFDDYISDLVEECVTLHPLLAGVCLDFIRTDDTTNHTEADNDAVIESIVQKSYDKVKAVDSNLLVSGWGAAWSDMNHPGLILIGRKLLNWLNLGIMDYIHAAVSSEYFTWSPNPGGKTWGGFTTNRIGTPMNRLALAELRAGQTGGGLVMPHCITWQNDSGTAAIGAGDQWGRILDSMRFEENISLYTAWLITDDQLLQMAEHRRLHGWIPTYSLSPGL